MSRTPSRDPSRVEEPLVAALLRARPAAGVPTASLAGAAAGALVDEQMASVGARQSLDSNLMSDYKHLKGGLGLKKARNLMEAGALLVACLNAR